MNGHLERKEMLQGEMNDSSSSPLALFAEVCCGRIEETTLEEYWMRELERKEKRYFSCSFPVRTTEGEKDLHEMDEIVRFLQPP